MSSKTDATVMEAPIDTPFPAELARVKGPALLAAIAGTILMFIGFLWNTPQASKAYLTAWLFCLGVSLGGMGLVMLSHLVAGEFFWIIRRFSEAAASLLPAMALLFIPIAVNFKNIYPWAVAEIVAHDKILQHRSPYMNATWVIVRALIYFGIWCTFTAGLRSCSANYDKTGDPKFLRRAQAFSAAGIPLYMITMTLAAVDWIMTLDPHFFSHIIGFVTVVSQVGSAMAVILFMFTKIADREPFKRVLQPRHLNDMGNLLLTLMILWAYMSFAQLLIIWMGNAQDDNMYYVQRGFGIHPKPWRFLALALLVLHFAVPFFILLVRNNKRNAKKLGLIALLIVVMRWVDVYWWVVPTPIPVLGALERGDGGRPSFLDPCAVVMLGGIWAYLFINQLRSRTLLSRAARPMKVDVVHGHSHGSHGPVDPGKVSHGLAHA